MNENILSVTLFVLLSILVTGKFDNLLEQLVHVEKCPECFVRKFPQNIEDHKGSVQFNVNQNLC